MSHFAITIITLGGVIPTPETLSSILAPYHEFECTGTNDQYVVDVDGTEDSIAYGTTDEGFDLAKALSWHGLEDKVVDDESKVDRTTTHQYGYAVVKDGQLIKAVNRTNPNKKWDWWVVGGRWSGLLKLKPGTTGSTGEPGVFGDRARPGYVDQALLRDIDVAGMRDEAEAEVRKTRATYDAAISGTPDYELSPTDYKAVSFSDEKRTRFFAQPRVEAVRKAFPTYFMILDLLLDMDKPVEDVVAAARARALNTYAVVKDGEWYGRGEMGWWGCSNDEFDGDEWATRTAAMLDELPDDAVLSIVDCHI